MDDPRLEREHELLAASITAGMMGDIKAVHDFQEELEDVQMDTLPPPGKYRIVLPGRAREVPKHEVECPDCHVIVRGGGGVAFFDEGEHGITSEALTLGYHHIYHCTSHKWRWHRFKWDKLGGGWWARKRARLLLHHKWLRLAYRLVRRQRGY